LVNVGVALRGHPSYVDSWIYPAFIHTPLNNEPSNRRLLRQTIRGYDHLFYIKEIARVPQPANFRFDPSAQPRLPLSGVFNHGSYSTGS
jgi:hypothetical protein